MSVRRPKPFCPSKRHPRVVTVWLFEVSRCLKKWPEKKSRTRQWASPRKAIRLLERPKLVAPVIDGIRRLERWDD